MINTTVYWNQDEQLADLFLGKKVVEVDDQDGMIALSDGSRLRLEPNEGGCSCGGGDYELTELNSCDNIITNVEVEVTDRDEYGYSLKYTLFVFADNQKVNLASVEGDDGSGYYGTGFYITVVQD